MSYWKPLIDTITGSEVMMDEEHHQIHAGLSFVAIDTQAVNTTTMKWMVVTPATTTYAHMVFSVPRPM